MNETCAVCGKPFEPGQRITCADGEPRHGGCNPGQIERERQDLLGADPERQALADAWGAWVREGRIRGWTQGHAEIVYRAFCAAWAAGRHDLDTEVTAVAARAAAAQLEADIKLADDVDAIYVARGDDTRLTGMLRFADLLAAAPEETPMNVPDGGTPAETITAVTDDDDRADTDFQPAFGAADYFVCYCGSSDRDGFTLTLGGRLHGMITCSACGQEFNRPAGE